MRLDGRTAVVTGAASGIGRASAHALAAEGARVVVADLNADGAVAVAEEIAGAGGTAFGIGADVSDESSVAALAAAALDRYGSVDVLHNNAAATSADVIGRDFDVLTMDVEVWDRTLAVNLRGQMLMCKHVLPAMIAQGRGAIVNMSSNSGLTGDLARVAYGASKGGVNALTMYVATMYGKQGVRCNAISPGLVLTPAAEQNLSARDREIFVSNHLTQQIGKPEDVARVVVFLASDDAAFVTGEILRVDGGMQSHIVTYAQYISG